MTVKDVKSSMKHLLLPTPPLWGRMYALAHSIPAVAKIALIGVVPSLKVGGIWMPVHWRHCSLNIRSGWERCLEMRPEYTFSLKSPRRMISESVWFQTINWAINFSKKIVRADRKSPWASKYPSCCSPTVVPAELAILEPEGCYAIMILVFLSPKPTVNQHQKSRPVGSTPDSATSAEKCPIAIIAQPPCWFRCICSFTFWMTILLVSIPTPITFLNSHSPVAWRQSAWVLQPAKISVLNWWQSLFNWLIFVPFVKIPKLWICPIITVTQLSTFPYVGSCFKVRKDNISSLVAEYLVRGFMRWW